MKETYLCKTVLSLVHTAVPKLKQADLNMISQDFHSQLVYIHSVFPLIQLNHNHHFDCTLCCVASLSSDPSLLTKMKTKIQPENPQGNRRLATSSTLISYSLPAALILCLRTKHCAQNGICSEFLSSCSHHSTQGAEAAERPSACTQLQQAQGAPFSQSSPAMLKPNSGDTHQNHCSAKPKLRTVPTVKPYFLPKWSTYSFWYTRKLKVGRPIRLY